MSRRHIVIAEHVADVVIVTPCTPHAARGIEADAITVTSSMHDDPRVHDLIRDAEPALIGSERRPEGAWDAMLAAEARDAAQPSALERRQAHGRLTKAQLIDALIAADGPSLPPPTRTPRPERMVNAGPVDAALRSVVMHLADRSYDARQRVTSAGYSLERLIEQVAANAVEIDRGW